MNVYAQVVRAIPSVSVVVLAMLVLSLSFPALGSPAAFGLGAATGVAFALREGIRLEGPEVRLPVVIVALGSAALVWLSVQPGYIGA